MRRIFCMPVFNESVNVVNFLQELVDSERFRNTDKILVLDDCSTDDTLVRLKAWSRQVPHSVIIESNLQNMGHGPSTEKLWSLALDSDAQIVVLADGDGEITPEDLFSLADAVSGGSRAVIGARANRLEPAYRKILSFVTRVLVGLATGVRVTDANSPYRALHRETLAKSRQSLLPFSGLKMMNLYQTAWLLRNLEVQFCQVLMRERVDGRAEGVSWKSKTTFLPSKRLIRFTISAFFEAVFNLWKLR